MAKYFLITLSWTVLRQNLAREYQRHLSQDEIEKWLVESGFTREGDKWRVREANLGALDPTEVLTAEEFEG